MKRHVLQSDLWEKFKNSYGTPAIRVGKVLYTKHKIPFTNFYYGYCPRVTPSDINFEEIKRSLQENSCVAIHFDVPNVVKGSSDAQKSIDIFKRNKCVKSSRDEFAKGNFVMDLGVSEDNILTGMHKKHRYNIKLARKRGVVVRQSIKDEDFEIFYELYSETGRRQKFFSRPRIYMEKVWKTFREADSSFLLIAEYEGKPLTSWMLLVHEGILYYPYGGSTERDRELQSSCLVGWEAIKFGKNIGCDLFDMWGAAEDTSNKNDPYYGFSLFKQKFGAKHVNYIDSYDFVVNEPIYKAFTVANDVRWKLLGILK